MLYFFSGTGNTFRVANQLSHMLGDELSSVLSPSPCNDETLGIFFPVYAWGLPLVVEDFIAKTLPSLVDGKHIEYVYCVMTHGDDMGYADAVLRKCLKAVGLPLNASFSLSMPNTYVCLPGFDVDSEEMAKKKIEETESRLQSIRDSIKSREAVVKVTRGALPFTKTYVLRPLFNSTLVTDRYFRTVNSRCTLCGKCVKECPLKNIHVADKKVEWGGNCTGCLRCYHSCPNNAVQFGKFTDGKGQKSVEAIKY